MPSPSEAAASRAHAKQQEPLIVNSDVEAQAKAKDKVSYSSLPNKKQLAILCIARLADPLAASSIQVRMPLKYVGEADEIDIHVLPTAFLQSRSFGGSDLYTGWDHRWLEDGGSGLHGHVVGEAGGFGIWGTENCVDDWSYLLWYVSNAL